MSHFNPVLDHILNSNRCLSLDLASCHEGLEEEERVFISAGLNQATIFKMPAPASVPVRRNSQNFLGLMHDDEFMLTTGIFLPDDSFRRHVGGFIVYLGQEDDIQLLQRHMGLTIDQIENDNSHDLRILSLLERTPSLDPFLLRLQFDLHGLPLHERYCQVEERIDQQTKRKVAARLMPIMKKALFNDPEADAGIDLERLFQDLWSTNSRFAAELLKAFRIDTEQQGGIFFAWQAMEYYFDRFGHVGSRLMAFSNWFASRDCFPSDVPRQSEELAPFTVLKARVKDQLRQILGTVQSYQEDYEAAYSVFLRDNNPRPMRHFLAQEFSQYWDLGYSINTLYHAADLFDRRTANGERTRLRYDEIMDMFRILEQVSRAAQPRQSLLAGRVVRNDVQLSKTLSATLEAA